ncbi:hypothetical protein TNCV_2504041 [Trichonephila clavipes]|nr:hypothetical protein TNCV_2504041 [Trichonephila clavipes]
MEQSTLLNVDLWSGREKKKREIGMASKRAENSERSLGYPGFVKPVITKDSKPLGRRKRSLGHLGSVKLVLTLGSSARFGALALKLGWWHRLVGWPPFPLPPCSPGPLGPGMGEKRSPPLKTLKCALARLVVWTVLGLVSFYRTKPYQEVFPLAECVRCPEGQLVW